MRALRVDLETHVAERVHFDNCKSPCVIKHACVVLAERWQIRSFTLSAHAFLKHARVVAAGSDYRVV